MRHLADIDRDGWRRVITRSWQGLNEDSLPTVARGIAFSGVMALVPSLIAFVSLYGLTADATVARRHLALLSGVLPKTALDMIGGEMLRIAVQSQGLGLTLVIGIAVAFWTAITGVKAMFRGLNIAYGLTEQRTRLHVTLLAALLSFAAYALLFVTTATMVVSTPLLQRISSMAEWAPMGSLRWPVLFGLVLLTSEALYRVGPSRRIGRWRRVSVGSLLTATAWLTGSILFSLYVSAFGAFSAVYGSLGAIFAVLIWSWLTALAILIGAKMNAEIERELLR